MNARDHTTPRIDRCSARKERLVMQLADAFKQACTERKELRLHIGRPNEDRVYRIGVRPLTYSQAMRQVTGLKSNGQSFTVCDEFVRDAEVTDIRF
jgi:hypothetical protein